MFYYVTISASNGLISTVTDAKGNATTTTSDILGRVLNVTPPTGPAVTYAYNTLDQLVTVSRGGATTSMTYDLAGRKKTMNDADMGLWSYDYDSVGNLTSQKDARNCITNLDYDLLNRPTVKTYANCPTTSPVTYGYDAGTNGVGRRTSIVNPAVK